MTVIKLFNYSDYAQEVDDIFEQLKGDLIQILGNVQIEHVGSSAVPGCISKGDLDIYVGIDKAHIEPAKKLMLSAGFYLKEDTLQCGELYMLLTKQYSRAAIQLVATGGDYDFFMQFRDALRDSPDLKREYNEVKRRGSLCSEEKYRQEKSKFIEKYLNRWG